MASKQISLCWDNFHKSMCTGMSSLLKNEDLVDVTIAVEGRYFKAHKMVLSVCSPYFRELFKMNPCKHPIVFMKDVSYAAMSDLLQFMYNGEVQVLEHNLSILKNTADALQITGLTTDRNDVQCTVNEMENKHAPSLEIERHDEAGDQENLILVKMELNDPVCSTSGDEFDKDPLDDENVDDFSGGYSMKQDAESKPGTSADLVISTCIDDEIQDLNEENSLPEKSKGLYMRVYADFKYWCQRKCVSEVTENDVLLYFHEKAENRKASSLWALFSMLKQTLKLKENINITKYHKVIAFLKRKNHSYKPKKAAVFEQKDITKFIAEAPDETFLPTKVILIMGIAGACRTDELCNMKVSDIDVREDLIIINIPETKNKTCRKFVISESAWVNVVKRYIATRPSPDMEKLFIGFRFGKPVRQNIGHNTISNAPNKIAKYLKLPNADDYTGHSFRRTSALISRAMLTHMPTRTKL